MATAADLSRFHIASAQNTQQLWFLGDGLTPLLKGTDSEDGLYIGLYEAAPSSQPPLHEHDDDDEIFYMLKGSVTFWAEGHEAVTAKTGELVLLPHGVPHTFQASPEEGATWLLILSPSSSFEALVDAVARPADYSGPEKGWAMDEETLGKIVGASPSAGVKIISPPGTYPAGAQK